MAEPERRPSSKTVTIDEGQAIEVDGLVIEVRRVWGRKAKFVLRRLPPGVRQVPADPPRTIDKVSTTG
jgi:hypothetical protein